MERLLVRLLESPKAGVAILYIAETPHLGSVSASVLDPTRFNTFRWLNRGDSQDVRLRKGVKGRRKGAWVEGAEEEGGDIKKKKTEENKNTRKTIKNCTCTCFHAATSRFTPEGECVLIFFFYNWVLCQSGWACCSPSPPCPLVPHLFF